MGGKVTNAQEWGYPAILALLVVSGIFLLILDYPIIGGVIFVSSFLSLIVGLPILYGGY